MDMDMAEDTATIDPGAGLPLRRAPYTFSSSLSLREPELLFSCHSLQPAGQATRPEDP